MSQRRPRRKAIRRRWSNQRFETLETRIAMSAEPVLLSHDWSSLGGGGFVEDEPGIAHHVDEGTIDDVLDVEGGGVAGEAAGGDAATNSLGSAHALTGQDDVVADYGFDGSGQTVVVIDSGIAYSHTALGEGYGEGYRVVGGWDFAENDADPYDDAPGGRHGTHVAGIIGSDDPIHTGVASGVDLVALRVFDDQKYGSFYWVEDALQWTIANLDTFENPITTVNLSLGTTWNSDDVPGWAMLEDEFATLEAEGVFISVSAGNSYTDFNANGVSYPAASDHVIPVMSVDDNGSLSYFSQRATYAIAAPGRTITSTVPDHAASDGDTIDDDWLSLSGTSMAAPYTAGASVLLREAMEFAGWTDIDQWDLYDVMMATADDFYDSASGEWYKRLNLEAAIDSVMPADDFGSTAAAAHSLGTIGAGSTTAVSGAVTRLDDADYFTFTAGVNGTATVTLADDFAAAWDVQGQSVGGSVYEIDVVAGQTYTLSVGTLDGLGQYDLTIDVEGVAAVDLGLAGAQQTYAGETVSGESWYLVTAGQDGFFTAEALASVGSATVHLFDTGFNLVADGDGAGRVDAAAQQGEAFYLCVLGDGVDFDLRLTNAVEVDGSVVTVVGSSGEDTIRVDTGANASVELNGVTYDIGSGVTQIVVGAGGGHDRVEIAGTAGAEHAVVRVGATEVIGATRSVVVSGAEDISVDGGGGADTAVVYGGEGDDHYVGRHDRATLSGAGFSHEVIGFGSVTAVGAGGVDAATLYGTAQQEWYLGASDRVRMGGDGFLHDAFGFESSLAFSGGGGDTATFYDTAGDDVYVAWSERAIMAGDGYHNDARGFATTRAFSTSGGADRAVFYDTADDEVYVAWSDRALMAGDGYFNDARGFGTTTADSSGGSDRAVLYGTAGDDRYVGGVDSGTLAGDGYSNTANRFARYEVQAGDGFDRTTYFGSTADEWQHSVGSNTRFGGDGFRHDAYGIESSLAFSGGGVDRATFDGTSGDDVYVGWSERSIMAGAGYHNEVRGFVTTTANAGAGGADRATFYDTAGDDVYIGWEGRALMAGEGYFNDVRGFGETRAVATTGSDRATLYASAEAESLVVTPAATVVTGSTYSNRVEGFASVSAVEGDEAFESVTNDDLDEAFTLI